MSIYLRANTQNSTGGMVAANTLCGCFRPARMEQMSIMPHGTFTCNHIPHAMPCALVLLKRAPRITRDLCERAPHMMMMLLGQGYVACFVQFAELEEAGQNANKSLLGRHTARQDDQLRLIWADETSNLHSSWPERAMRTTNIYANLKWSSPECAENAPKTRMGSLLCWKICACLRWCMRLIFV